MPSYLEFPGGSWRPSKRSGWLTRHGTIRPDASGPQVSSPCTDLLTGAQLLAALPELGWTLAQNVGVHACCCSSADSARPASGTLGSPTGGEATLAFAVAAATGCLSMAA